MEETVDVRVARLARRALELSAERDRLEHELRETREAVKLILGVQDSDDTTSWCFDNVKVMWVRGGVTEKLDRKKLVQAGVTAEVLDAATVKTPRSGSLRVTEDRNGGL